ncbi:hypothetical protein SAMN04489762_1058 [Terribacillus saccharophilus]|uniref:Uncharacterized protein n=1 Tax=Terribacillus saccharophilus TaxID=361277 RepID=A0AAX2EDD9_9BACI|nr:hypothetical protein SAMN04489762_1058 [Terribacillus saccharophilus]
MKRKTVRRTVEVDDTNKLNRDFKEIFSNYKLYTTKAEWRLYLLVPIAISTLLFVLMAILEEKNTTIYNSILDINNVSVNVIAILAGFNTTCLSIIAASNNKVLKFLTKKKLEGSSDQGGTVLKQIVVFFSFSIVYELIIIFFGILLVMVSKYIPNLSEFDILTGINARIILVIIGIGWLSAILFALVTSLRNASLLYRYVLFVADYRDDNN